MVSAYKECYYEINNIRFLNILNNLKYKISVNNNFILIRYYLPINITCDKIIHCNITDTIDNHMSKFLFLDIALVKNKNYRINMYNNDISRYYIYDRINIINDQMVTLIYSFITKK